MRTLTLFVLFLTTAFVSLGQKITYNIPSGLEKNISQEEYKKIVDMSVAVVGKRYSIESVKDGTIQLKEGQDLQGFNLDNLIVKCVAVVDRSTWDKIILEHFGNLFEVIDEPKNIEPKNYDSIKKYIGIRIYPVEMVNARGGIASLIARTDLEGTYSLLMLDLPKAFTPVSKQMVDLWSKDTSELFKIAVANTNKQPIEKVTKSFPIENNMIEISFLGSEVYAASYALDLQNNSPELVGEWGAVVAIPNRGLVDLCKISKDKPVDFVKFIQMTKPMIEKSYQEHEQPVSDQFFWYYKGKFTKITVLTDAKGNINVISPFGLTALMTGSK